MSNKPGRRRALSPREARKAEREALRTGQFPTVEPAEPRAETPAPTPLPAPKAEPAPQVQPKPKREPQPGRPSAAQPDSSQRDSAQIDSAQLDSAQLDSAQLDFAQRFANTPIPRLILLLALAIGVGALGAAIAGVGPRWLSEVGAVGVASAMTWLLAERTGGRPNVSAAFATLAGAAIIVADVAWLRAGAAAMTAVVGGVMAVMMTVPAKSILAAVRETCIALLMGALTAVATLGWTPAVDYLRFRYVVLALGLVITFVLVYRLGAGLHGLGRRGVIAMVGGLLVLGLVLAYAEALRHFSTIGPLSWIKATDQWLSDHFLASPRIRVALVGAPALMWGTHMRARRRQGWWVCAFGSVGTLSVAGVLVDPSLSALEGGLAVLYGTLIGLTLGWLLIRIDLQLIGSGSRRARAAEEAAAERREAPRFSPL